MASPPDRKRRCSRHHGIENKPPSGQCPFFFTQRNKYCALTPVPGSEYCITHLQSDPDYESRFATDPRYRLIPCPVDPSHVLFEVNLKRHLGRCNRARLERSIRQMSCFCERINVVNGFSSCGYVIPEKPESLYRATIEYGMEPYLSLLERIDRAYDRFVGEIPLEFSTETLSENWDPEARYRMRHILQESSIISAMKRYKLLDSAVADHDGLKTAMVELGCGKAGLSAALAEYVPPTVPFVLVDRESFTKKAERHLDRECHRIRMDLVDFDMRGVETLSSRNVCAFSKHLCGPATDLALQCILRANASSDASSCNIESIAIALCCHHRCVPEMYLNPQFLVEEADIRPEEFFLLVLMCSWATTFEEGYNVRKDFGEKIGKANQQNPSQLFEAQYSSSSSTTAEPSTSSFADENEVEEEADHEVDSSNCDVPTSFAPGESWLDIPLSKRLEIGRKCKRILDVGRIRFLQKHGFDTFLIHYVTPDVSPENAILLGVRRSHDAQK